jgi:NAD(P)H dehydrogenase (quinone)
MAKVLIIYHSRTGRTKAIADALKENFAKEKTECVVKDVKDAKIEDLKDFDGIIIGAPTYYGSMSAEVKKFLDDSVKLHTKLDGKVGGAFTSSVNLAGGNETTILSILNAMLIHGMIIQGDPIGSHYGPVLITDLDDRVKKECERFASRFVRLLKKVA